MIDFLKRYFDVKFWRYCLIGFINTIIGVLVYFAASRIFKFNYDWSIAAQVIISNGLGYYMNRKYNFKDKEHWLKSMLMYAFGVALSWVVSYILLKNPVFTLSQHTAAGILGQKLSDFVPSDEIVEDIAMCYGLLIFITLNYSAQRFLTFKKADDLDYKKKK